MALPYKEIRSEAIAVRQYLNFYAQCLREGMRFIGTDGTDYTSILAEDIEWMAQKLSRIADRDAMDDRALLKALAE